MALASALVENQEGIVVLTALLIQVLSEVVAVLAVERVGLVESFLQVSRFLFLSSDALFRVVSLFDSATVFQGLWLSVNLLVGIDLDLIMLSKLPLHIWRHRRLRECRRLLLDDSRRRRYGLV